MDENNFKLKVTTPSRPQTLTDFKTPKWWWFVVREIPVMFRQNLSEIYDSIWPDKRRCVVVSNISSNLTNIFQMG